MPGDDVTSKRPFDPEGTFGPYTITGPLGAGGMGLVYRARDNRLGRDVAIKVIRPGLLADDAARKRFRIEALALGRLNHPNIAAVYDVGVHDGSDYLVMEFVPGQTLKERLASGALSPKEAVSIGCELAGALEEAHEQQVVHRDLKPGNIMVTPKGHAKILDFGLAKLLAPIHPDDVTQTFAPTGIVGTPLYMSPEQAEGRELDARTDLWSLGVVLYESLAGVAPFRGDSGVAILRSVTSDVPDPVRKIRPDVPEETARIVSRALEKNVDRRYQSASQMGSDLSIALGQLSGTVPRAAQRFRIPRRVALLAALVGIGAAVPAAWLYHRYERLHWARDEAIPQIEKGFKEDHPLGAFLLLQEAQRILPNDARLATIVAQNTYATTIDSSPPGATVEAQDYITPEMPWVRFGVTPLREVRVPEGYLRWRVSKPGFGVQVLAPVSRKKIFALDAQKNAPAGMVYVRGGVWFDMLAFLGWLGPYTLPAYDIDRLEVTNRDYQKFVDSGGYSKREYWAEKLLRDGREVSWDEAMAFFRDSSGRAGPSTWEAGHYPDGQADYPVSGVSWYEASAYAAFAGKSLPALAQWYRAAPADIVQFTVRQSNISRARVAPVGTFSGTGPFGTLDMIGNVREWIENADEDGSRFILGGAWNSLTYLSVDPEALPPFNRSPANGFRCVRNSAPLSAGVTAPIKTEKRDFVSFKPASDEVFRAYQSMYAYEKTPLNAKDVGVVEDTADWRKEKITFDAAYGDERVTAYLFLPKKIREPFQTVVFSPSARVLFADDSKTLEDMDFFDYIVKSGRAVLYPVYKGTYERHVEDALPGTHRDLELRILRFKDLGRSIDYLRTRPDIDMNRLAYLGVSMGAAEGVIYCAFLQDALRTAIFLDGGYFLNKAAPGADQADFAPRLKKPVLMVNGRYDFTFSLERSQEPMFRMLGTDAADKRHVVMETPHDVTARKPELVQNVLPWLDKYLGRVE